MDLPASSCHCARRVDTAYPVFLFIMKVCQPLSRWSLTNDHNGGHCETLSRVCSLPQTQRPRTPAREHANHDQYVGTRRQGIWTCLEMTHHWCITYGQACDPSNPIADLVRPFHLPYPQQRLSVIHFDPFDYSLSSKRPNIMLDASSALCMMTELGCTATPHPEIQHPGLCAYSSLIERRTIFASNKATQL